MTARESKQLTELISRLARTRGPRERKKIEADLIKSLVGLATNRDLDRKIAMTENELSALLDAKTTQINKVAKEQSDRFDKVTARVKELEDAINTGGNVSPAVTTAMGNLDTAINNLDAAIPDDPNLPPTDPAARNR